MFQAQTFKNSLAFRLLKIVFSIYLVITTCITLMQLGYEYQRENEEIIRDLHGTQAIFEANLTAAAWTFNSTQLEASLEGIQKIPIIVGVQILNMDNPPAWTKAFPIRLGKTLNKNNKIISANESEHSLINKGYIYLIPHHFQLKEDNIVIADVIFYSSNQIIHNKIKYLFFNIIIAAVIKTIILWLLFFWAFRKFLGEQLNDFCQTMENVDIDNSKTTFLKLKDSDVEEFHRIETVFNLMFKRVLESKNNLDDLNITLENKVLSRTQELSNTNKQLEYLNEEKNEFLSIAAHDLKSPLANIISLTDLIEELLKTNQINEKLPYYNSLIKKGSRRMITLIETLLDVNKIESGNISANFLN